MSGLAVYAQRLAKLPAALGILELHPAGLPLAELADELGVGTDDLRDVFLAYYLADLVHAGDYTLPVVEFFSPSAAGGGDADPVADGEVTADSWVRVVDRDPEHDLGVDHLSAEQLARLASAGADLLALEPDNATLRSALDVFRNALWPAGADRADWQGDVAARLHEAARDRRRVRIEYVRQWRPGVVVRTVDPYRLLRTRRGWELDAGPADDVAPVRTYLVSGIESCEVLDATFEPPADLDAVLHAQRAASEVSLVVPQERRWAVERFAENVVVESDDESDVSLRARLLPPVAERLGLLLLSCGPEAFVVSPAALADAGTATARLLLAHHRGEDEPPSAD